jgi:hypothetical protein
MRRSQKTTKQDSVIQLFSHRDVLVELLRSRNIHTGRWQLVFELGHVSTNVNAMVPGKSEAMRVPAGMVLIQRIGILPTDEVSNLTVDAAAVNPAKAKNKISKRSTK